MCNCISSSEHIKWCEGYSHLRENLDPDSDEDWVKYFQQVIKIRDEADLRRKQP